MQGIFHRVKKKLELKDHSGNITIGFDGFIDEIIHVIKTKVDYEHYTRFSDINEFAGRIKEAAGYSTNLELLPLQKKLGGNGPIMANALLSHNHNITYIGALGKPKIHPVFKQFASRLKETISIAQPGHTDALEFKNGKIMLGKMKYLEQVNWQNLLNKISIKKLRKICIKTDLFAFANWTMLPKVETIFSGLNQIITDTNNEPYVFIDLADPQKRCDDDIAGVLKLLTRMESNAKIILGLNKRESEVIARILHIETKNIVKRAVKIRENLKISYVVIHPLEGAAVSSERKEGWINGPYTENPVLTTGAGDNFNAGFCHGILKGLSELESLAVGVATSGFYVRNCHSPTKAELISFLEKLSENTQDYRL